MKTISAHVTGFYRSSFHAYTTEVTVDGHRWRLGLRYSKFHDFYDQLMVQEKDFHAEFPPKGTLFFTPKPEERQEQLELFLQQVLAYYSSKTDSIEMENLLCDLLKVPRHLRSSERDDDNVSTSTESAQDEPMHEPVIEKKNDEKEKTQVADTNVDLALHVVATETVKEREKVVADVKEGEKDADLSELMQPVSPVANESRSVELTEEAKIALDAVEAEVEIRVEESEAAKEMVKEDVAVADKDVAVKEVDEEEEVGAEVVDEEEEVGAEVVEDEEEVAEVVEEEEFGEEEEVEEVVKEVAEEEVADASLLMPAEGVAAETKEAATIDAVSKTYVESSQVSSLEEMDVILPPEQSAVVESISQECTSSMPQEDEKMDVMSTTKQSVVESVAHECTSPMLQVDETMDVMSATEQSVVESVAHECTSSMPQVAEEKGTIIEEQVKENELATRGRVSSWIAAYVPKSLLGFFQRRCMKKTNLVVLCLALLLPMALARR